MVVAFLLGPTQNLLIKGFLSCAVQILVCSSGPDVALIFPRAFMIVRTDVLLVYYSCDKLNASVLRRSGARCARCLYLILKSCFPSLSLLSRSLVSLVLRGLLLMTSLPVHTNGWGLLRIMYSV